MTITHDYSMNRPCALYNLIEVPIRVTFKNSIEVIFVECEDENDAINILKKAYPNAVKFDVVN